MVAYAFDSAPPRLWEPHTGPMPARLRAALTDPGTTKIAWNCNFERSILWNTLGIDVPLAQWFDVMVYCRSLGFPGKLEMAALALHLPKAQCKEPRGNALIKLFSVPTKATKPMIKAGSPPFYFKDHLTHPKEWDEFGLYCMQDVNAERYVYDALERFGSPLPDSEYRAWIFDQQINNRGVPIDVEFLRNASALAVTASASIKQQMEALTGVKNANSGAQLLKWLGTQGHVQTSMDIPSVSAALKEELSPDVRRLFEMKQERAGTAHSKLASAALRVCEGRITHSLGFVGAHTGRWTSTGLQLQNFKKAKYKLEELTEWVDAIRAGTLTASPVPGLSLLAFVGSVIRSMIRAPEGRQFILCDLSQIEARTLAWLAGCENILSAYREGRDLYREFMGVLLSKPPEEVTSRERDLGKICILGCGYQMGWQRFQETVAKDGYILTEEQSKALVGAFREQYPEIPRLWKALETHFMYALEDRSQLYVTDEFQKAYFDCSTSPDMARVVLPSGRALHYFEPRFYTKIDNFGRSERAIQYTGFRAGAGRSTSAYGGHLTENLTQAISRDILLNGMWEARRKGFTLVSLIHDEIICEESLDSPLTVKDLEACMTVRPEWADASLPLKAEGFVSQFYRK
jgi:DNA polymerase